MKNLETLKKELETIKLEERLEMVQLATTAVEAGDNGCCNTFGGEETAE
jgi:hypothetical protein